MRNRALWATTVVLVLVWSIYNFLPMASKNLAQEFQLRVPPSKRDDAFKGILTRLAELQKANPDRQFANLLEAIGTNDITRYFPLPEAAKQGEPTRYILNRLQREGAGKMRLGLDLQGGTSFLVAMQTNALIADTNNLVAEFKKERALSQAVEVLRRRVDKFGVAEPIIQPAGNDRILIQLPGLAEEDKQRAMANVQKAAFLEFRLVHPNSREQLDSGMIEPGYEILKEERRQSDGSTRLEPYVVKRKAERGLTGSYVTRAMADRDPMTGAAMIRFEMNNKGAELFGQITEQNIGRQLAIVLDGVLYSAPVIQGAILGGSGQITGDFTIQQAQELAAVLENPLEAPVKIIESREIAPSLGKDTIRSGIKAAIIGVAAVSVFMLCYYMLAGFIANIALMCNIVILFGVMCYIRTTFTLPGIAGIVLTVGMAVDANVLIYERIREELGKGKSLRGAIAAGYDRAFSTIFDSHVTTLISSVILIFMGTGPVKGFGVALTIGVAASLFTALVVTRLIFEFLLDRNLLTARLPMLHLIRNTKINFMRWAVVAFAVSWTVIGVGNLNGVYRFVRGDVQHAQGVKPIMGPDFVGGDQQIYEFAASQKIGEDQLRATIMKLGVGEPSLGYQRDSGTGATTLRVITEFNSGDKVESALKAAFPQAQFNSIALDRVGPTVGKEITRTALLAALLAMFGILIYVAFRYEFSFAVGAVVAIIHDILMTLGIFFLSGREFSAPIVAAVLTIIGFSINDTIVIFDRIREDLKLGVRGTFQEVMNQALNQTLSRTLITSGTVFLSTMALYLFGGGAVNDFAFTFLVGILTGTYSSIYIASALVLWWHKGQRPTLGQAVAAQPVNLPPGVPAKA
jgi:SecD/SecF fusion protein